MQINEFSFIDFYQRRINRIFPALLLVLISSLVIGWFSLNQYEYKQLGKHIASGAGFISNLTLWSEVNYFDNAAETKPLLHLWSLATRGALPFLDQPESDYIIKAAASEKNAKILISAYWLGRIGMLPADSNFSEKLNDTIQLLQNHGHPIGILLDTPGFPFEPETCLGNRWSSTDDQPCTMKTSAYQEQISIYEPKIQAAIKSNVSVKLLEVGGAFCDSEACRMSSDGFIYFRDFHHLNINGSIRAGQHLVKNYGDFLN